jgi:hypothetical protein
MAETYFLTPLRAYTLLILLSVRELESAKNDQAQISAKFQICLICKVQQTWELSPNKDTPFSENLIAGTVTFACIWENLLFYHRRKETVTVSGLAGGCAASLAG